MKSPRRAFGALIAVALSAGMLVPQAAQADHEATYNVQVGQEFFEQGVPGFSGRFYPGSINVHQGDTIRFDFPVGLGPEGLYPQEAIGTDSEQLGSPGSFLELDPDEGPKALKFNLDLFFGPGEDCGTEDNPCVWGSNADVVFPAFPEEPPFDVFVRIDAAPGTTLWAASLSGSDANVNFRVRVVGDEEDASTQAELDARGERLRTKDYEDALALHRRMNARRTWHINQAGRRVYDVFVGASGGPIELFAMYPRRIAVPRRARVQFHFMSQVEPHTATFGGPRAREVFQNFIVPSCDPDGDGPGPNVPPTGEDPDTGLPICPEGTELEAHVHPLLAWKEGDGRVMRNKDYENSGLIFPRFPEGSIFDENPDPWTVRFPRASNRRGFRFICLIHGPLMGGFVRVLR